MSRSAITRAMALLLCLSAQSTSAHAQSVQQSAYSPSLLPAADRELPLLLPITGSARLNDADDLLGEMLDLVEQARGLGDRSESGVLLLDFDIDPVIAEMKELDGRVATARGALGGIVDAPLLADGWYLSANGEGRLAGTFVYDPEDEQRLRSATMTAGLSGADLESTVQSAGIALIEVALMRRVDSDWFGGLQIGTSVKYQYVLLHERNIKLVEYEDDDLFDRGRDTEEYHFGNIDIGLTKRLATWNVTAVLRNLVPGDFDGPISAAGWKMRPHLALLVAREFSFGQLSIFSDVTERDGFSHVPDERLAGIELITPIHPKLNLITGYNHFDNGIDSGSAKVGLDYVLLEHFHLSAVAEVAGSREGGARVQVQLFF